VEEQQPPKFHFVMSLPQSSAPHELDVDFTEHEGLPHRINLLIGRNGTGKTQLLAHLAQTLYGAGDIEKDSEALYGASQIVGERPDFSKIISISYSAFDQFPIPKKQPRQRQKSLFDYRYCGLRNAAGAINVDELKTMLDGAMEAVETEDRIDILKRLIDRLLGPTMASEFVTDKNYRNDLFQRLSAGQRFIVAIAADITGFIELRSIILFDEPEKAKFPWARGAMVIHVEDVKTQL
jgi:energy-coupling factor transporter ATP-binding protein EcfA2